MKILALIALLALVTLPLLACNNAAPVAPFSMAKPPCHDAPIVAAHPANAPFETLQEVIQEKAHRKYPECSDDMRLVFRSKRELHKMGLRDYDTDPENYVVRTSMEDQIDLKFGSAFCVSDKINLEAIK